MDPFTRHMLAGHTDMNTTKRYVHPNEAGIHEAMAKVWVGILRAYCPRRQNHAKRQILLADRIEKDLSGATRRDRTGDLLITNQPLYQLS